MPDDWKNTLYYGDNLDVLRKYIRAEKCGPLLHRPALQRKALISQELCPPEDAMQWRLIRCLFNESGQPAADFLHVEARGGT